MGATTQQQAIAQPTTMDVDDVLTFTQAHRIRVIELLTKTNSLPEDPKEQVTLLKALDGMDKAVSVRKRLVIDENTQKSTEAQAEATASLLRNIQASMFESSSGGSKTPPDLTHIIPVPELVPGETDIGPTNLNYEIFIAGLPSAESRA